MSVAATVLAIVLAVVLVGSAIGKLRRAAPVVENLTRAGVPDGMYPFLAAVEVAGAVGLVAGIWWAPIGVAAAIGVVLYFVGAVGYHLRQRDYQITPPVSLLLIAVAAAVTRALA